MAETRRIVERMIDQVLAKLRTAYIDRLQGTPGTLSTLHPRSLNLLIRTFLPQVVKCIPKTKCNQVHRIALTKPNQLTCVQRSLTSPTGPRGPLPASAATAAKRVPLFVLVCLGF